jgi:membrane fusion protein (multidrug efflux system)
MISDVMDEIEKIDFEALDMEDKPADWKQKLADPKFRRLLIAGAAILFVGLLAMGAFYGGSVSTEDAQVDGHIAPIASKVYGNVIQVLVDDNQHVKAGQVLVRIDRRDYQVKVDQARAALALAEAQAKAAQVSVPLTAGMTASETSGSQAKVSAAAADFERAQAAYEQAAGPDLASAQASIDAKKAQFEKANSDLERMKPLLSKAEISQQEFDSYSSAARVAESELKAAQENQSAKEKERDIRKAITLSAQAQLQRAQAELSGSRASEQQVPIRNAEAASAQASVDKAKADLEAAELQLSYTTITAPVDGVITRKSVETGQVIQAGQQLIVLIPLDHVWVTANFKETQLKNVHSGQEAEIKVDMYGHEFHGHVDSIAGATGARTSLLPPENATGNFVKVVQRIPVKILVDANRDFILRPGMNVEAKIITK